MLILGALVSGLVADATATIGGRGLRIDLAVGLMGSALAGGLLWSVTGHTALAMLAMCIAGSCGAAAALAVQRHFWPAVPIVSGARGPHLAGGRADGSRVIPAEALTSPKTVGAPGLTTLS
jgi:uncharacterized membrane protein YeaQ/YmgE (transglycosylase-associated protein family)